MQRSLERANQLGKHTLRRTRRHTMRLQRLARYRSGPHCSLCMHPHQPGCTSRGGTWWLCSRQIPRGTRTQRHTAPRTWMQCYHKCLHGTRRCSSCTRWHQQQDAGAHVAMLLRGATGGVRPQCGSGHQSPSQIQNPANSQQELGKGTLVPYHWYAVFPRPHMALWLFLLVVPTLAWAQACEPGSFSASGAPPCNLCPAGKFSNVSSSTMKRHSHSSFTNGPKMGCFAIFCKNSRLVIKDYE